MPECQLWRQDRASTCDWPQINLHVPNHFSHHARNTDPSRKIETDDFETELPRYLVISIAMTGIDRTRRRVTNSGFVPGIARHAWKRNGVDPIGTLISTLHRSSMKITSSSGTRETEKYVFFTRYRIKPDTFVIYVIQIRDFTQ